ncbi:uncharacterized protein LOC135490671 [Lineus longissimus]|uniref:uncharacterized protein LOC135490671 n=1 Tax=Lineus longissimus TaxID=88925 RepID=UPI002B4EB433
MDIAKAIKFPQNNIKAPLKATVVAVGPQKSFQNTNGTNVWTAAIADKTAAMKINIYDQTHAQKFIPNNTILITNYSSKGTHITTNNKTKIYKTKTMVISTELRTRANDIINPPDAPLVTIQQATSSPLKTTVTIEGTVTQADAIRMVNLRNSPQSVPIKDLTIKTKQAAFDAHFGEMPQQQPRSPNLVILCE